MGISFPQALRNTARRPRALHKENLGCVANQAGPICRASSGDRQAATARNLAMAEHRPLSPVRAVVSVVSPEVPERHPDGSRLVIRPLFHQPIPQPAPSNRQAETEPK